MKITLPKRIGFILFLLMLSFSAVCMANAPQKVAVMPIENHISSRTGPVNTVILDALDKKFAGAEYQRLSQSEINMALAANGPHKKLDKAYLSALAHQLNADIVVAPAITSYRSQTRATPYGEFVQSTDLCIRLMVYYVDSDRLFDQSAYRTYTSNPSRLGDPDYLAGEIMDQLLGEL